MSDSDTNTYTDTDTNTVALNQNIILPGYIINNEQGKLPDGTEYKKTVFETTDPNKYDPQINQILLETIDSNYDDTLIKETGEIVDQIKLYAGKIKCESFHGKGTIEDYSELFIAASTIANETKQMELNVDIDGFNEFGKAADELSNLFTNFTLKLQNINIINDTTFLNSILIALKKIFNLSETFGRFKETILATSSIKLPKSAHITKNILNDVMSEVNCAMGYISNFINPNDTLLPNSELSIDEKNIISSAVSTIDNWNILCNHGVSIALEANTDVQSIGQINSDLKNKSNILTNLTDTLKLKLANYNIHK